MVLLIAAHVPEGLCAAWSCDEHGATKVWDYFQLERPLSKLFGNLIELTMKACMPAAGQPEIERMS